MTLLLNLFSMIPIALRRIWHQRLLMACLLLGLVAAVALSASIPLYADAVQFNLLQTQLADEENPGPSFDGTVGEPVELQDRPFAFLFRYIGAWHGAVEWGDYGPVNEYLIEQALHRLDLPLALAVRHVRTENFRLYPEERGETGAESPGYARREPLIWTSLAFISGLEDHVDLLEGWFPAPAGADDEEVEALISQALANRLGLQTGEQYVLLDRGAKTQVPVRIAGVWRARDPADPFWFYAADAFNEILLAPEATFTDRLAPALKGEVYQAVWYQVYDGDRVRTADVPGLLERVAAVQARAAALLPNIGLDASPVDALQAYRRAARLLTLQLTIFSLPVFGLLLYFIGLIGGMVVRRRQNEIAVLRSRGASRWQVTGMHLLEGLVLGGVALVAGLALAGLLARRLGAVHTFLDPSLFTAPSALTVVLSPAASAFGGGALAAGLLASLLPALAASRHTIVTYKQEVARTLRPPVWQRFYADLLLLAPALYGYYVLRRQGSLSSPLSFGDDPFQNPLLFIVPVLFCFALALLFVRVFPLLMRGLAGLAGRLPGTSLLLALRHLARSPAHYVGPMALLILTLSLAAFTASMALTLDGHLVEQIYYRVGADLNLAELGESTETPPQAGLAGQPAQPAGTQQKAGPKWLFLPVTTHLQIDDVQAAARVGDYTAVARLGDRQEVGRLIGVDRVDFGRVAFFRRDFAGGRPLGALMNELALSPDRVLASRAFLARHGLGVGDRLVLSVQAFGGERAEMAFTVAGALDIFPTVYPEDGPVFVANLDYVYQGLGEIVPYDVWLRLAETADPQAVVTGVRDLGIQVVTGQDARAQVLAEQTRPERQGVFGLLSIGFLAAAGLTVLGFLLYTVVSFQRRFIELGMLRAVGLSAGQMAAFLISEQGIILLAGMAVGTGLGVWASRLFIPFLQAGPQTPPFVVRIAWNDLLIIYAIFGAMFAGAVGALVWLLGRMRLFEAVKLGEAV